MEKRFGNSFTRRLIDKNVTFVSMYKLRKIKRKDLEIEKYSKALNASMNYRIYAEYWYLDVLTDGKWECWIYGDYEILMPIPYQLKFGIKFVIQPTYCQQLGVFYREEILPELFQQFEKKLHGYFVRSYCFNEENTDQYDPKGEKRVNHILDLNRDYVDIKKGFSKSTKWNLKQFEKSGKTIDFENTDLNAVFDLKMNENLIPSPFYQLLRKLVDQIISKNIITIGSLYDDSSSLSASSFFVKSNNRIIYLSSIANKTGKKMGFPTGLLNEIIFRNSDENIVFDFEGSSIPQISSFFCGFGAKKNFYTLYKNSNVFDQLKNLYKKYF